ncbi:MAG: type II secretion system GspH family protein [Methylacidiphilales bacterium]|nr:type II secretion system GspH family protein [Candidatus Methylacidiphilales bacterium]
MKKSLFRSHLGKPSSFTLVELLVVIGIIAILASVAMYGASSAIKAAKRAKAQALANSIQTASLAYYTEYGVYPVPGDAVTGQDYSIADNQSADWKALLYGLCGNINPYDSSTTAPANAVANTHGVAFLSLKNSDVDVNGGPLNPLPSDTTHIYFNIAIDNDYDGILGVPPSHVLNMPKFGSTFSATGGGSSTAGIALWANCNGSTTSTNQNFYVKTY